MDPSSDSPAGRTIRRGDPRWSPSPSGLLAKKQRFLLALPSTERRAFGYWLESFYPFQLALLLDWSRFRCTVAARQIGKSHVVGAWATIAAALGESTNIVSKTGADSDEVLDKAMRHARALTRFGSERARITSERHDRMKLQGGGRVMALNSESGGRGYTGHMVLDEFPYHEHPEKVWDAAAATTTHGGMLWLISTPNGVGNLFSDIWHDRDQAGAGYAKQSITIDQAIAEGFPVDLEECWKRAHGDARLFDQLYRCRFLDGAEQYIPDQLIAAASQNPVWCPQDAPAFAGLDIGRTADLTALVIVREDHHRVAHVVHCETLKRTTSGDIARLAAIAMNPPYGCRRLCVDATGMGSFPTEDLRKRYGPQRVEAVTFTLPIKEDLATTMFSRFQTGSVRLPPGDGDLRDDVAAIRRTITSAGNVRYDAAHTQKGHADRAWALALALHGCARPLNERHEIGPVVQDRPKPALNGAQIRYG